MASSNGKMVDAVTKAGQGPTLWQRGVKILVLAALFGWLLLEVYPLLFLFFTSFKTDPQILNTPFALPSALPLDNYIGVWLGERNNQPFAIFFRNSVIVTAGTLLLLLAVASLAGYALARGRFPGSAAVQQSFLLSLAVPAHVLLIPIFFFMERLGLRNSLWGLILMYTTLGLPFTVLLMRAYFLSFPRELEEAAMLDGCTRLGTFWRVVVPVSKGALASMAIVNITWIWSELFFALILLNRMDMRTLPLAIASYSPQMFASESTIAGQFAAMALATIPMIVFYFLFQRQITKGMTMGAFR